MSKVVITAYAEGGADTAKLPSAIKLFGCFMPTKAVVKSNKDVQRSISGQYRRNWFLELTGCELWIPVSSLGELLHILAVNPNNHEYRTVNIAEVSIA